MPTFKGPVQRFQYPTGSRLLDRMRPARGVTVYSTDGGVTWKQNVFPYLGDIGNVDGNGIPNNLVEGTDYFLGGHTYHITTAQATALKAAGFGANITGLEQKAFRASQLITDSVTLPNLVTAGNLLVACFSVDIGGLRPGTIQSVSGCGATWTAIGVNPVIFGTQQLDVWVGTGATGGSTVTVNVRPDATFADYAVSVSEWSGHTTATASGFGTSGTSTSILGQTMGITDGQVGIAVTSWNASAPTTFTPTDTPAAFTQIDQQLSVVNTTWSVDVAYFDVAAAAAARNAALSTSQSWLSGAFILS